MQLTEIEQRILEQVDTYQWPESATMYSFAAYLGHSESFVRRNVDNLLDAGEIERIAQGKIQGKPRYIYRKSNQSRV
jgi:predicted transcriptional regulator